MLCSLCRGKNQVERCVACLNSTNITDILYIYRWTKRKYYTFFTPRPPPYISRQIDRYFRWPRANAKTSIINRFVFFFLYYILPMLFLLVKFFLFPYNFCMLVKCKNNYIHLILIYKNGSAINIT